MVLRNVVLASKRWNVRQRNVGLTSKRCARCTFIGRPLSGDGAENLTSGVATKRVDRTKPC